MVRRPPKPADRPSVPRFKERPLTFSPPPPSEPLPKVPTRSSKRLLKDIPNEDEILHGMGSIKALGDHAMALVGAAYLDHILEQFLRASFRPLDDDDNRRMFDGSSNGILGTFSNKIRMCYAMKLISFDIYHDLVIINDIRNAMAHSLRHASFKSAEIAEDCRRLKSGVSTDTSLHESNANLPVRHTVVRPVDIYEDTVVIIYAVIYAHVYALREMEKLHAAKRARKQRKKRSP